MPGRPHHIHCLHIVARYRRVLAGVLAAVSVSCVMWATTSDTGPNITVVALARDVPTGHVVRPGDVITVDVPSAAVPDGALTELHQVKDQRVGSPIRSGSIVTDAMLQTPDSVLLAAAPGTVAVALPVQSPALRDRLSIGDSVMAVGCSANTDAPSQVLVKRAMVVGLHDSSTDGFVGGETKIEALLAVKSHEAINLAEIRALDCIHLALLP